MTKKEEATLGLVVAGDYMTKKEKKKNKTNTSGNHGQVQVVPVKLEEPGASEISRMSPRSVAREKQLDLKINLMRQRKNMLALIKKDRRFTQIL